MDIIILYDKVSDETRRKHIEEDGIEDLRGIALGKVYCSPEVRDFDFYAAMDGYTKDVQIIHGTADVIVPIEYSQRLAEQMGDQAILIEVEGAGHDYGSLAFNETRISDTVSYLQKELLE